MLVGIIALYFIHQRATGIDYVRLLQCCWKRCARRQA